MTEPFAELKPAQAEQVVARFIDGRPQALAGLRDRLAASGQDDSAMLDGSVGSLVPLWTCIKGELRARDDNSWESEAELFEGQPAPEWYRHEFRRERTLSLESVHLLDGVVAYVGEVVMGAVSGIAWRRGHHRVRSYAHQNRPVLGRGDDEVAVSPRVYGTARSHLIEPGSSRDDELRRFAERCIDELRRADAPDDDTADEPLDAVLDVEIAVERGAEADEWIVEFSDDALMLVGQPALDRLADLLPGKVGVIAAIFEDREVLVASGTIDPKALKQWIVTELTQTAITGR